MLRVLSILALIILGLMGLNAGGMLDLSQFSLRDRGINLVICAIFALVIVGIVVFKLRGSNRD